MHPEHLLDAEAFHQAVVEHRLGAGAALFGGLEDDHYGPREIAALGQVARRAKQHGGVAIVAAGMHLTRDLGAVGEVGLLLDWQRVHVGAKPDRTRSRSLRAANDANDSSAANGGSDLVAAEGVEPVGDELGGQLDIVEELGILVDFLAPALSVGNNVLDGGTDRHRGQALPKREAS